ncbi:UbiH/UbiF/VisC/COQ6 family ubiquinone biosynthesis hydroxylase [Candidatus Sororendozoicomonas aggregata]|uniref:UbiH/UbiF/VisC/COQ6 family ubiquinone biosynthesis hydroxylase n=1 Tax=Candidatus Sororendozoicomonas aggregata TaxID=3073239 RepID=UPI002ECFEB06
MKEQQFDVLIVGAGMIGSAMANALGSANLSVALFDQKAPSPFNPSSLPDIRVSALSYASEQILTQLGAWKFMQAMRMCPYQQMAVWEKLSTPLARGPNRMNKTLFDAADIGHPQLGFIVENSITQRALHQAMSRYPGIRSFCPNVIQRIDPGADQPSITLSDGRRFTGQVIIGADGANSAVRQAANIGLNRQDYEQQCLVATVEIDAPQAITWQAFTPTGPESFLPLPSVGGRHYASVVWYHHPDKVAALKSLSDRDFITTLAQTFPAELPAIKQLHGRASFPLARRHAQTYYKKGVVLAGDAAHTINPLAGQGVNLGFQDVAWLAEILVDAHRVGEDIGNPDVLARYEKNRRPDNQRMMTIMDGFYHTFSNDHFPLKVIRNIGLTLAGRFTPAVKQVMKYAMGLSGKQPRLAQGLPVTLR